jgi:hypothetical protein
VCMCVCVCARAGAPQRAGALLWADIAAPNRSVYHPRALSVGMNAAKRASTKQATSPPPLLQIAVG